MRVLNWRLALIAALFPWPALLPAQTAGVMTLNVTDSNIAIVASENCDFVVVRENSARPVAGFSVTLAGFAVPLNYPVGAQFEFSAGEAGSFKKGQTIGYIRAYKPGPFAFVAVESNGKPSMAGEAESAAAGGECGPKRDQLGGKRGQVRRFDGRHGRDQRRVPDGGYGQITGVNLAFQAKTNAAANLISHGGGVSSVDVAIEHNTYSDERGAAAPVSPDTPAGEPAKQK